MGHSFWGIRAKQTVTQRPPTGGMILVADVACGKGVLKQQTLRALRGLGDAPHTAPPAGFEPAKRGPIVSALSQSAEACDLVIFLLKVNNMIARLDMSTHRQNVLKFMLHLLTINAKMTEL